MADCICFKVHKQHQEGVAPPKRPVISGSGALTENPSKFCQYYMKQVSKDHWSYLLDMCDFLRHIKNIENLPPNSHLVTIDITGLYTHIPRDKGVQATRKALYRRKDCIQSRKKFRKSAYQSEDSQTSPPQRKKNCEWNAQMQQEWERMSNVFFCIGS